MADPLSLTCDPDRGHCADATGIYVRAQRDGKWASVDIAELDRASLLAWLRSGGREEQVVLLLLGHDLRGVRR